MDHEISYQTTAAPSTQNLLTAFFSNIPLKSERTILKTFLLSHLYQLFCELFRHKIRTNHPNQDMEYYVIDRRILQLLIEGIIESEQYTLEGIAIYTRIPLDVIYEVAGGFNHRSSISLGAKLAELYLQVNPEAKLALINKLLVIKEKTKDTLSYLLKEG